MKAPEVKTSSWLCRDDADRERLLDMETRLRPKRAAAFAVLAAALLATAPWVGMWTLIPLAVAGGGFMAMDHGLARARRPEYRLALAWVLSEVAIAASVAATGGPHSAAIGWFVVPVVTLSARFSARGVAAGLAIVTALMIAATVGVDPSAALHDPSTLALGLGLVAGVALLSMALMQSDLHHRNASVIDPLTSMLNRGALQARTAELAEQAPLAHKPVGVIVGDLDRFKEINDEQGHAAGDAVLRDVAYRMRKQLRAFDLAYRLGGEEFVVLLPGADRAAAEVVAGKLRAVVAAEPFAGRDVTMTFGVSASPPGEFDYASVFAQADAALYEGKRSGRDRVSVNGQAPERAPAFA
jgi:diguanylate cyclase (GGDEF)-like protein